MRYRARSLAAISTTAIVTIVSIPLDTSRTLLSWPPPYTSNPYLTRLTSALVHRGINVRTHRSLTALCARPQGARWLHLHWPEWLVQHSVRPLYKSRIHLLTLLLDLARSQGLRLAWTAHNLIGHDDLHPDLAVHARRALLSRCDVAFGHFSSAEPDLRSLGLTRRFVLTPHPHFCDDHPAPFSDLHSRNSFRETLGVGHQHLLLVSAGAIEPYKNLDTVARALRSLPDEKLRWIIAGRARPKALSLIERALSGDSRVTVRAFHHTPDELSRLVASADATLIAYKQFYTSGSAVLSLSLGTPVVGTARNHLAAWRSEPFFVALEDVSSSGFALALEALRGLGPQARCAARTFAQRTSWATIADTIDTTLFGPTQ